MGDVKPMATVFDWPWVVGWPTGPGSSSISFAPERLSQPINPGWTFGNVTINSANSSAPEVEQAVVSRYSYGKQIGRMADALQVLIKALPATKSDPAIKAFIELAADIDAAKSAAQSARLLRLQSELNALKKSDRKAWDRLVKG
jgi:hypothetical protein